VRPAASRISRSTPILAARSRTGDRSADAQLESRSQAAPAATEIAVARSVCCRLASDQTSAEAKAAASLASSASFR
jgi:hypothetical protein